MNEIEELRALLQRAHERFASAIQGLETTTLETEPATGIWSIRDIAGHLADWQQEMLDALEHMLGGPKPRQHPITDVEGHNMTRSVARSVDPWPVTAADLDAARERAEELLVRMTPAQLDAVGPYPWDKHGTARTLLAELVGHLDEHVAQIEAWRSRRAREITERA